MSGAIGPGDWVEALVDCPPEGGCIAVSKGGLYCVETTRLRPLLCTHCGTDCPGLRMVGDQPLDPAIWWPGCGFRPIYRPKADLIESLKAPPLEAPQAPTAPKIREDA